VPDVVGAFERRASRVVTPRSGWAAHAARPLLATRALTRDVRAAAPDIRRLFAELAEHEGAGAAISERYRNQAGSGRP
jgi:hypothetical protein